MSVIELNSPKRIDEAWDAYTEFAKMLSSDPHKLMDREFHQEFARRYERWRVLYLRSLRTLETA